MLIFSHYALSDTLPCHAAHALFTHMLVIYADDAAADAPPPLITPLYADAIDAMMLMPSLI